MLQTRVNWEYGPSSQLCKALFNQEGVRQYALAEVLLGGPIILVNVLFDTGGDENRHWSYFIFHDWDAFLELVEDPDIADIQITFLPRHGITGRYSLLEIEEIVEGKNAQGKTIYLCKGKNGTLCMPLSSTSDAPNLSVTRTIWSFKAPASSEASLASAL